MKDIGVYIHIPFCKRKCLYCDFNSFTDCGDKVDKYISCVQKEIQKVGKRILISSKGDYTNKPIVNTVYFGGGTPSFIDERYIERILRTIETNFEVPNNAEVTIEVNPGTVDRKKIQEYAKMGVNRLSIGLQAVRKELLEEIGRIHTYEEFLKTFEMARSVGFENINIDLMIGLPNQTIYDVEDAINKITKLNPEHISVYSLIVEENTPIEKLIKTGELKLPDEEIERYMYWFVKRKLEENRYEHYEISNFAKPRFKSRHNLACWNQEEYLGFGVSASSYENRVRFTNTDDIDEYIKNIENDQEIKNVRIDEKQDDKTQMDEYMILGLRKLTGVNISEFKHKFIQNPLYIYSNELTYFLSKGLIIIDDNYIRLSKKGLDFANQVWEEFIK